MARFKVGDHVRLVRYSGKVKIGKDPVPLGSEGVIAIVGQIFVRRHNNLVAEYCVSFGKGNYACWGYQLEPVNYDGNKLVSWDEMPWKPKKEYA